MSFSLVRPLFGFRPVIARSTCVDTAQFLRHRPLSAICRQPVHVPKTWVLDQLGIATGQRILPSLLTATGIAGIALGIATCTAPTIHCDNKGMYEWWVAEHELMFRRPSFCVRSTYPAPSGPAS